MCKAFRGFHCRQLGPGAKLTLPTFTTWCAHPSLLLPQTLRPSPVHTPTMLPPYRPLFSTVSPRTQLSYFYIPVILGSLSKIVNSKIFYQQYIKASTQEGVGYTRELRDTQLSSWSDPGHGQKPGPCSTQKRDALTTTRGTRARRTPQETPARHPALQPHPPRRQHRPHYQGIKRYRSGRLTRHQ